MRTSPGRIAALLLFVVVGIAACEVEININNGDDAAHSHDVSESPPVAPVPSASATEREVEIPPPPAPRVRPTEPEAPAEPTSRVSVRVTATHTEEAPPAPRTPLEELAAAPTFTPFTVAPSILNRSEVIETMEREYPPLLKDAGIGGTVRVYFFIDADGNARETRIDQSSGHPAIDDAAMNVAGVYRFSPAENKGDPVPVWVSFPITFAVR